MQCHSYCLYLDDLKLKDSFFKSQCNSILRAGSREFPHQEIQNSCSFQCLQLPERLKWIRQPCGLWIMISMSSEYYKRKNCLKPTAFLGFGCSVFSNVNRFISCSSVTWRQGVQSLKYFDKAIISFVWETHLWLTNSSFICRWPVAWIQGIFFFHAL